MINQKFDSMNTVGHLMRLVILLTAASFVQAENLPVPHLNIVPQPVGVYNQPVPDGNAIG